MTYLLDTNILLEALLEQGRADTVREFMANTDHADLRVTDFSVASIGIVLQREHREDRFADFINDTFIQGTVGILHLAPSQLLEVVENSRKQRLDYDDAYQYTAARAFDLTLVSFDSDFDRTDLKRKVPEEILHEREGKAD